MLSDAATRAAIPKNVKAKLRRIGEEIEDLTATLRGLRSGVDQAQAKVRDLKYLLDRARNADRDAPPHVRGARNPARERAEEELAIEITKHARFVDRTNKAIAELSGRLEPLQRLREAAEDWLSNLEPGATLRAFDGDLDLPPGADLAVIRRNIGRIKADIRKVEQAPRSVEELAAVVDKEVERLRQAGSPNLSAVIDGVTDAVRWPVTTTSLHSFGMSRGGESINSVGQARSVDVPALVAWLFPEVMRDRLHAELSAQYSGGGLSAEERATRLAELHGKLLAQERVEEHIISTEQPEQPRRVELDQRAFLGLADDCPVPSAGE